MFLVGLVLPSLIRRFISHRFVIINARNLLWFLKNVTKDKDSMARNYYLVLALQELVSLQIQNRGSLFKQFRANTI